MGKFSIGLLLSFIAMLFMGIFMVKFILKAIFFVLAAILFVGLIVMLAKRL